VFVDLVKVVGLIDRRQRESCCVFDYLCFVIVVTVIAFGF